MEVSQVWSSTVRSEAVKSWFSDCTFTLKKGIDFVQQRKKGNCCNSTKKYFNILLVNYKFRWVFHFLCVSDDLSYMYQPNFHYRNNKVIFLCTNKQFPSYPDQHKGRIEHWVFRPVSSALETAVPGLHLLSLHCYHCWIFLHPFSREEKKESQKSKCKIRSPWEQGSILKGNIYFWLTQLFSKGSIFLSTMTWI